MRGDFSRWDRFDPNTNFRGVLHQQGRVFLDSDWNAQARIFANWQETLGRDAIGPRVFAVPADEKDANPFKVISADKLASGNASLRVNPGRGWADGMLCYLNWDPAQPNPQPVKWTATPLAWLGNPIPAANPQRQAVILEVSEESRSAFQRSPDEGMLLFSDPEGNFLEPALGGPDTTERVGTRMALRLLDIGQDDDCESVQGLLKQYESDDRKSKGQLTVSLTDKGTQNNGDCAVTKTGGYMGLEHKTYRIEIAEQNDLSKVHPADAKFKWSEFNGGMVGHGTVTSSTDQQTGKVTYTIQITGNLQAILYSNLFSGASSPYLEVLSFDTDLRLWRATYGAPASLNDTSLVVDDSTAVLKESAYPLTQIKAGQEVFFRIWNGIAPISGFKADGGHPNGIPLDTSSGILLNFTQNASDRFLPGDYWVFEVRAGLDNATPLLDQCVPHGIEYRRACLALLQWDDPNHIANEPSVTDCRHVFKPLVDAGEDGCCLSVAPGEDVAAAIKQVMDAGGGCICLLPGKHLLKKAIDLTGTGGIRIKGAGAVSRLEISDKLKGSTPFNLSDSYDIAFESFLIHNPVADRPLVFCKNTDRLTFKDMIVMQAALDDGSGAVQKVPVFAVSSLFNLNWVFESCFFAAPMGIWGMNQKASAVAEAVFRDCLWTVVYSFLDIYYVSQCGFERNVFTPTDLATLQAADTAFAAWVAATKIDKEALDSLIFELAWPLQVVQLPGPSSMFYVYLMTDSWIVENQISGDVGLNVGTALTLRVMDNQFISSTYGILFGYGENISIQRCHFTYGLGGDPLNPASGRIGIVFFLDVRECKILDNVFKNMDEGFVSEAFGKGKAYQTDLYTARVMSRGSADTRNAGDYWKEAKDRTDAAKNHSVFADSMTYELSECGGILIRGNLFEVNLTGVRYQGYKEVTDFRISQNTFLGCTNPAILLEPRNPAQKGGKALGRYIDGNRFEVEANAIYSTIGDLKVEDNDIYIVPTAAQKAVIWRKWAQKVYQSAAKRIYGSKPMEDAFGGTDAPLMRVMQDSAQDAAYANAGNADIQGFASDLDSVDASVGYGGMSAYQLKGMAKAGAVEEVIWILGRRYAAVVGLVEGFAVILGGQDNSVVGNRIVTDLPQGEKPPAVGSGILLMNLSGVVKDNDVVVPETALLINGNVTQPDDMICVQVSGNRLDSKGGVTDGAGNELPHYSLLVPTLLPGSLSVQQNCLEGDVVIGSEVMNCQDSHPAGGTPATPSGGTPAKKKIIYNTFKIDPRNIDFGSAMKAAEEAAAGSGQDWSPRHLASSSWGGGLKVSVPFHISGILDRPAAGLPGGGGGGGTEPNPMLDRPIVQFADNRVVGGSVTVAPTVSSAYFLGKLQAATLNDFPVITFSDNALDDNALLIGFDVLIVGNYSYHPIRYRTVGTRVTGVMHSASVAGSLNYPVNLALNLLRAHVDTSASLLTAVAGRPTWPGTNIPIPQPL